MRNQEWTIVLGLMLMVGLVLAACTEAGPSAPEAPAEKAAPELEFEVPKEEVAFEAEPSENVPPELCPPGIECEGEVKFDAIMPVLYQGKQAWVQHGLHANAQGELFRMNVTGVTSDTVEFFTKNVRVCLDQIFTDEVTRGGSSEPPFDLLSEGFGANSGDLIIETYPVGFVDPKDQSGEEIIEQLRGVSAQEWMSILNEMGYSLDWARSEELKQDFVVDFVIDPFVGGGSTHRHPQKSALEVSVLVSVDPDDRGSGSVGAELYLNTMSVVDQTTVIDNGTPEAGTPSRDSLDHDNEGTRATYDLMVRGEDAGWYRLSGRGRFNAGTESWVAWIEDKPPPCKDFCFSRKRGETTTFPISTTAPEMPIPRVDVLLLFDVTGSMSDEIEEVKKNASDIMETVMEKVDAAFGVGSFADYPHYYDYGGYADEYGPSGLYPWSLDQDITTDTDAVQWTLDALEILYGGDDPASYSRALFEARFVGWRADAKKIIILFGDAMPHDLEFFQEEFGMNLGVDPGRDEMPGTPDDQDFRDEVAKLRDHGIEVIAINSAPDDEMAVASFGYMAYETGGQMYRLDDAADAPTTLMLALETATEPCNQLTVFPHDSFFDPWVTVAPPAFDYGDDGEVCFFEVTVTVPEDIEPGLYEFYLIVSADDEIWEEFHVVLGVPQ